MRLLTRYILREVVSHALLGGVLFTFVLFTTRLGKILELVVRGSASLTDVGRLITSFLPEALIVTIPMAVLVGILLGLSRLASDSEITAMRAAGMGASAFVRIVSIVAFAALALGLANSLYLAPRAATELLRLEASLKYAQASFEVDPRVFDEDFKNVVLYVQDVRPGQGAALWRHVFIADLSQPRNPLITTADQALVSSDGPGNLHMLLRDGGRHEISPTDPNQYNISTFSTTDLPLAGNAQEEAHLSRSDTPILALSMPELIRRAALGEGPQATPASIKTARPYRIEFNKRFSYPFACLVLMLVGVPLGLSSKRGGKSTGFVLTILLVFVYYALSLIGIALATQGKLSPFAGVWGANLIFAAAGAILLQQLSRGGIALSLVSTLGTAVNSAWNRLRRIARGEQSATSAQPLDRLRATLHLQFPHIQFPQLLDNYILRTFASTLALVLAAFSLLFLVFTFFELIGDIIHNRTPLVTVGDYLLNLIPFILYKITPLCVLVSVLVTFGGLTRSSEITAMKAAGVSLYRAVLPVLVVSALIGATLFAFDESYLPAANRRQEGLRNIIKGKPPQTVLRPDRKWISGQTFADQTPQTSVRQAATQFLANPHFDPRPNRKPLPTDAGNNSAPVPPAFAHRSTEPARIFYYQFFDPDRNVFANLSVFEINPASFTLERRIFAGSARWDPSVDRWIFENGWVRTFAGETIATYEPFTLNTFPEIREQPQYFKKEDRQSQQMSFVELSRYIEDLRQSGFDTKRLMVQLNDKLAYPAITLVMALLAIPFALSTGKRGGVAGFAVAILMAVLYLGTSSLFDALGDFNTLPPALAAWSPDVLFGLAGAYLLLRTPT